MDDIPVPNSELPAESKHIDNETNKKSKVILEMQFIYDWVIIDWLINDKRKRHWPYTHYTRHHIRNDYEMLRFFFTYCVRRLHSLCEKRRCLKVFACVCGVGMILLHILTRHVFGRNAREATTCSSEPDGSKSGCYWCTWRLADIRYRLVCTFGRTNAHYHCNQKCFLEKQNAEIKLVKIQCGIATNNTIYLRQVHYACAHLMVFIQNIKKKRIRKAFSWYFCTTDRWNKKTIKYFFVFTLNTWINRYLPSTCWQFQN